MNVETLADEYLERLRSGAKPSIEEYAARYPSLAGEIREFFPALQLVEHYKPNSRDGLSGDRSAVPREAFMPRRLGDFQILREIAKGGMGVVYEAVQQSLGRHVALKVLPPQTAAGSQRQRFAREARAAARLHHTNIVPVFGVGEQDGIDYYAMQYISGLGLDKVLEELRRIRDKGPLDVTCVDNDARAASTLWIDGRPHDSNDLTVSSAQAAHSLVLGRFEAPSAAAGAGGGDTLVTAHSSTASFALPEQPAEPSGSGSLQAYWRSVARIGVQAAEALQYAHDHGVLHRDIKPSNLLLDACGTVWVTDFGLAKADDQDDLTHTGDIVGTIRYMAPEVFSGQADRRSDVYSLGVTLYELLAMRPAFAESNRRQLVRQVLEDSPPRLRSLDRQIPRDLETIVHKAMERDARLRYPSAAELAADLNRYLRDEPIRARRVSALTHVRRWCWRNKAVSSLAAALALVVVAGMSMVLWSWRDAVSANGRARAAMGQLWQQTQAAIRSATAAEESADQATRAQQATAAANKLLDEELRRTALAKYALTITLAFQRASDGDLLGAEELLEDCPRELLGWEYGYVKALCRPQIESWQGHDGPVTATAFSHDGSRLATAGRDHKLCIWDVATHDKVAAWESSATITHLEFSRDGQKIVSYSSGDCEVTLRETESGKVCWSAAVPKSYCTTLHIHPDGSEVLASGQGGWWRRWNAATGEELPNFPLPASEAVISPDGAYVAVVVDLVGSVVLWNVAERKVVASDTPKTDSAYVPLTLHFHPRGEYVSLQRTVVGSPHERVSFHLASQQWYHEPSGSAISDYSADGRFGVEMKRGQLEFWDTHKARRRFRMSIAGRRGVSISPEGNFLAAGTATGLVELIRAVPQLKHALPPHEPGSSKRLIAIAERDSETRRYEIVVKDAHSKAILQRLAGHPRGQYPQLQFSPDFQLLASLQRGEELAIVVWDPHTGRKLHELQEHRAPCTQMTFHPDGRLVSADEAGVICVWDVQQGRLIHRLDGHAGAVRGLAVSIDGKRLLSFNCSDATARLWDLQTGKVVRSFPHSRTVTDARLCPQGRLLATYADSDLSMWDVETGALLYTREPSIEAMVFSPDGQRLVASATDRSAVTVLHSPTGQELLVLPYVYGELRFSADGRHLEKPSRPGVQWRGAEIVEPLWKSNRLGSTEAQDGAQLLTIRNGVLQSWDLTSGQRSESRDAAAEQVSKVAVSSDGKWIAFAARMKIANASSPIRGKLWVVDRQTGREIFRVDGFQGIPERVTFSPDGTKVAAVHKDTTRKTAISVWEAATGRRLHQWRSRSISATFLSPRLDLAVSRDQKFMRLVDLTSGMEVSTPIPYSNTWNYYLSPTGFLLATAPKPYSKTQSIQIWDLTRLEIFAEFPGTAPVDFHPGGFLACAGADGSIELWDYVHVHKLASFRAHLTDITDLTFDSTGSLLVSGDARGMTKVWDVAAWLPPAAEVQSAEGTRTSLAWAHPSASRSLPSTRIRVFLPDLSRADSLAEGLREQRYDTIADRLAEHDFEVVVVPWRAFDAAAARPGDVLFLPTGWAQPQRYDFFESRRSHFHAFVQKGGGLVVCQPSPRHECTPTLLPYPITFRAAYDASDRTRINVGGEGHFLTRGLKNVAMPFPADPMIELDSHYQVLAIQRKTQWPSLAACTFGRGRVVVQTSHEGVFANERLDDEMLRRIIVWAAGRDANE